MDRYSTGFRDLLRSLTGELPAEQGRLDDDYLERARAAEAMFRQLPSGCEALVPALAPSRSYLSEVSLSAPVGFANESSRETGVAVDLLSLGYRRRFAYAGAASSTVSVQVRQSPLDPAPLPPTPGEEE